MSEVKSRSRNVTYSHGRTKYRAPPSKPTVRNKQWGARGIAARYDGDVGVTKKKKLYKFHSSFQCMKIRERAIVVPEGMHHYRHRD